MKVFICILAYLVAASCLEIKYAPCKKDSKGQSEIISVAVEPCSSLPCALLKGQSATIIVKFKPTVDIKGLDTGVHGKIGFLWMPFPLPNSNGCEGTGLNCPLKAGQEYTYKISIPVQSYYPSLKLVVSWQLTDTTGTSQVCFMFPTQLK